MSEHPNGKDAPLDRLVAFWRQSATHATILARKRALEVCADQLEAVLAALRVPEVAQLTCECGHEADEHGNDGTGPCGASKACRSGGCKQFKAALHVAEVQSGEKMTALEAMGREFEWRRRAEGAERELASLRVPEVALDRLLAEIELDLQSFEWPMPERGTLIRFVNHVRDLVSDLAALRVPEGPGESLEDWVVREARAIAGPRTHLQDSEALIQFGLKVAARALRVAPTASEAFYQTQATAMIQQVVEQMYPTTLEERIRQWRAAAESSRAESKSGDYLDGRAFAFERCADEAELALRVAHPQAPEERKHDDGKNDQPRVDSQ